MSDRRMVSRSITETDAFLDMPSEAKVLYFYLMLAADDRGFVDNPRSVMRMCGVTDDAIRILIAKKFVLCFERNGDLIYLIKHWRIHNYIAKDRFRESKYKELLADVYLDENQSYSMQDGDGHTPCIQSVYEPCTECNTQYRLGKDRIDKDKIDKERREDKRREVKKGTFVPPSLDEVKAYVAERKSSVNPQQFYDYFSAGNWVDSKGQKVKNWKQKLITWEKHEPASTKKEDQFGEWGTVL